MQKTKNIALILALSGTLISGTTIAEENNGWIMAPYKNADFEPHFTFGVTTGNLNPELSGASSDTVNGLVLSLNCPWFQPPTGTIRQVFNYNIYDDSNYAIKTFEINPRYFTPLSPSVQLGYGPGFGYMWVDPKTGEEDSMWTFQLGADIDYRNKNLFAGVSARYMATQSGKFGASTTKRDVNNTVVQLRVGYNF